MNIALLKSKTDKLNITIQQEHIIKYAKAHHIRLDTTEIESSDEFTTLENRSEFKGFLRSLSYNDNLIIYDLWVFSNEISELIKIFECLLKRDINIYICNLSRVVDINITPLELMTMLSQFVEKTLIKKEFVSQGRPKGRMSTSKFDPFRVEIIDKLSLGDSVSKISRDLKVSRTSLKDYINSRGLKELVEAKKILLNKNIIKKTKKQTSTKEECSLIKENNVSM